MEIHNISLVFCGGFVEKTEEILKQEIFRTKKNIKAHTRHEGLYKMCMPDINNLECPEKS